ncbi:hypothetical protein [Streptomyces thermolilacinus]|uniref:hypothetical protein n=1 Tax=Streptomyces thermolilacinus TaxID=285540 RepID=UPI0003C744CD|nr:hypothetical protein [Streptomyces thermolilacinus]
MTSALRTVLSAARARRTARHLARVSFCDSCAQVGDRAARAAERRRHHQLTALAHAPR